jgi:hypothetical protein
MASIAAARRKIVFGASAPMMLGNILDKSQNKAVTPTHPKNFFVLLIFETPFFMKSFPVYHGAQPFARNKEV